MPDDALTGGVPGRSPAPLVILDRDGVINQESAAFIRTAADWQPIAGSLAAIARLTAAGVHVYVATNQSGVGRGLIQPADLDAIHARMTAAVEAAGGKLAGVFFCPHAPDAGCDCRKPATGLLRRVEAATGWSLAGVPVIGDSARDLAAGRAVGARPILVLTGNGVATAAALPAPVESYADLASAVEQLLRERAAGAQR